MEVSYSKGGDRIPRPVLYFFVKAFVLFVVWKAFYIFFLLPAGILDRPLTRFVGGSTSVMLNAITGNSPYAAVEAVDTIADGERLSYAVAMDIRRDGQQTLRIADACNGLELMVLYIGFIICFPAPARRKLVFILSGCVLITILNILRCAALVIVFVRYKKYLDFSHHFAFTFLIYAFIFILWYFFTKKPAPDGRTA